MQTLIGPPWRCADRRRRSHVTLRRPARHARRPPASRTDSSTARRSGRAASPLQLGHRAQYATARITDAAVRFLDLRFMDIAATVNPATVHSGLSRSRRRETSSSRITSRPARALQAAGGVLILRDVTLGGLRPITAKTREEESRRRPPQLHHAAGPAIGARRHRPCADHIIPRLPGISTRTRTLI